jgi:hypothetical protein
MRHAIVVVTAVFVLFAASPSQAQNRAALEGFGGVSIAGVESADSITPNLGGTINVALIPNIHLVGEVGRLGNVLSPLADSVFSLTGAGIKASALYGEGGVRLVAAPRAHVSPYVEATAGVARFTVKATGLGYIGNTVIPAAVGLLPHTGKVAGAGGGLVMHAGALQVDVGYRYKELYPPDLLGIALGFGQSLHSQQVRVGLGVRF